MFGLHDSTLHQCLCQFKIYYVVQPRVQKNHSRDSDRWAVYPLEVAELVSKENTKATGA